MNFLKKLFGSKTTPSSKDDASIKPVRSQVKDNLNREPKVTKTNVTHDDIEPIVKQTVEILFKNVDNRKKALKVIRKYKKERKRLG